MEIRHKQVDDLTPVEYRACRLANYGAGIGYMWEEITNCREKGWPGRVILLWDGPEDKVSSLIGWALLTPVRTFGLLAATPHTKKQSKYTVQLWVKRQHRRKGYGHTLMREVKKLDPRPHVLPHDNPSAELFSSYTVTVLGTDAHFLKRKPKVA